jgi:hypothetical protein
MDAVLSALDQIVSDPSTAERTLMELSSTVSYPAHLCGLITSADVAETIRIAAAIQLRGLYVRGVLTDDLTVDDCISLVLPSPSGVQVQLALLLREIIKYAIQSGSVVDLLEQADSLLSESPFISVLIFRSFLKEVADVQAVERVAEVLPQVCAACFASLDNFLFLHVSLLFANWICRCGVAIEPLGEWLRLIVAVLRDPALLTDKDACKLAVSLLELRAPWTVEQAADVVQAMVERLTAGAASYKAVVQIFKFASQGARVTEFVGVIEPLLPDFLASCVFPVFVLTDDDCQTIQEDLLGFITTKLPVFFECISPISSARMFLSECHHTGWTEKVVDFAVAELTAFDYNQCVPRVYAALLFASYALQKESGCDPDSLSPFFGLIHNIQESIPDNPYFLSAFLLFLSHIPNTAVPSIDHLFFAFDRLLHSEHPLIVYSAAAAIANLLQRFEDQKDEIAAHLGSAIEDALMIMLALNQELPTDTIAEAIRIFFKVFLGQLLSMAAPARPLLFSLYCEYASDERAAAIDKCNKIHMIIRQLLRAVGESGDCLELFELLLCLYCDIFPECPTTKHQDLLELLMDICHYTPELTPMFFQFVPHHLRLVSQSILGAEPATYDNFQDLVKPLLALMIGAPSTMASPACFDDVTEILRDMLLVIAHSSPDAEAHLVLPAVELAQGVFILLRDYELPKALFQPCLELVTEITALFGIGDGDNGNLADVIAALVTMSPVEALANECNFAVWLGHSSALPFLRSVEVLFEAWDFAPPHIGEQRDLILKKVSLCVQELSDADSNCHPWTDDEDQRRYIFDKEKLLEVFIPLCIEI